MFSKSKNSSLSFQKDPFPVSPLWNITFKSIVNANKLEIKLISLQCFWKSRNSSCSFRKELFSVSRLWYVTFKTIINVNRLSLHKCFSLLRYKIDISCSRKKWSALSFVPILFLNMRKITIPHFELWYFYQNNNIVTKTIFTTNCIGC